MPFRLNPRATKRVGPFRVTASRGGIRVGATKGRLSGSVGRRGPSVSVRLFRGLRATVRR